MIIPADAAANTLVSGSVRVSGTHRPKESAWDFVALGKGHDVAFWTEFLRALHEVDPDMLVNIEHEDTELGRIEGLQVAAAVLKEADGNLTRDLATI